MALHNVLKLKIVSSSANQRCNNGNTKNLVENDTGSAYYK